MGKKKTHKGVASNISSGANPASSSTTQSASKSSILQSSFCPSRFQLSLFASVIQGLGSQHLRIHDTSTGRLQCEHAIEPKASITCLDWGYYGRRNPQEPKRKRKRHDFENGDTSDDQSRDVVVALGTSVSDVLIFSPLEAKILGALKGGHTQGIRDYRFAQDGLQVEGWSIGGDGKLVQWDLKEGRVFRTVQLPHGPASAICPLNSSVICASHRAYIFDPASREQLLLFDASTNPVHTIVHSIPRLSRGIMFLTAAENDRSISVFNADEHTSIGSLRTESEVLSLDFYSRREQLSPDEMNDSLAVRLTRPQEAIIVVDKDGVLEMFCEPFDFGSSSLQREPDSLKARMKRRTRKPAARIRLTRPDKSSSTIPLVSASFQGSEIVLAWTEGGIQMSFEKIQWRDDATGNLLLRDFTEIVKEKSKAGLGAAVMNGVKDMGKTHVNESHTVIVNGEGAEDISMADEEPEVISISSAEEESVFEEDGPAKSSGIEKAVREDDQPGSEDDVDMEEVQPEEDRGVEDQKELEEPSFGDLLRANAPEAVDVQAAFTDRNAQNLVPTGESALQKLPSGMSLGTVLTQSLRTNDTNLLETCFHVKDLSTIRATIERLDSSFATSLLQRLAERLHSRPGRAGSLMVWIQWTLVAHGGYLAGQPELMKKLASLHRVVKDRANSLQPLLSLKGKLDMLEAQNNLRKSMQVRSRAANNLEEDDEEGIIYVEGQTDSASEDDEIEELIPTKKRAIGPARSDDSDSDANSNEDEGSEGENLRITNGVVADSEGSHSDDEGLLDEEASSTDNDSANEVSEDDVDHESVDSVESSDAEAPPQHERPAKSALRNGVGSRKR